MLVGLYLADYASKTCVQNQCPPPNETRIHCTSSWSCGMISTRFSWSLIICLIRVLKEGEGMGDFASHCGKTERAMNQTKANLQASLANSTCEVCDMQILPIQFHTLLSCLVISSSIMFITFMLISLQWLVKSCVVRWKQYRAHSNGNTAWIAPFSLSYAVNMGVCLCKTFSLSLTSYVSDLVKLCQKNMLFGC